METNKLEELYKRFNYEYKRLYESRDDIEGYYEAVTAGNKFLQSHIGFVVEFNRFRGDILSSDREIAAFMLAVKALNIDKELDDAALMETYQPISFVEEYEKMQDFRELSKEEFLALYSYLNEADYDATVYDLATRLSAFTNYSSESIAKQILDNNTPQVLEEYAQMLNNALVDPYTFFGDIEAECKARDLLMIIDKNAPFDYSRIHFHEDVMYDADTSEADNPRATVDMLMWLTDRQYKDLVNMIDFSDTALSGCAEQIKSGLFEDNISVNVYAVLGADIYNPDTKPENANVEVIISITADMYEEGNNHTENCVWGIPVSAENKRIILAKMDSYARIYCDSALQELLSEAKEEGLLSFGSKYAEDHHIDGISLAKDIADFSYVFEQDSAQEKALELGSDPKTVYTDDMVSAFQQDPVAMSAAFSEFFDEEMQALFSDEQRTRFEELIEKMNKCATEAYHGFEFSSYEVHNTSQSSAEYIFKCPDNVLQEYIDRIPPSTAGIENKTVNNVRREDNIDFSVMVSTDSGSTQVTLRKEGWGYTPVEYRIPLSEAEHEQINVLIAALEQGKFQGQEYWTNVMNDVLNTVHIKAFSTKDLLENTQLSLPKLNEMVNGMLDTSDDTVFFEPASDFRTDVEVDAIRQLTEEYPVCLVDALYSGNEMFNHPVSFIQSDPMQLVDAIEGLIEQYYEIDMKMELRGSSIDVAESSLECYQDYIDLGMRLKDGSPIEKEFYQSHEQDFIAFDLFVNHFDEVDISKIIQSVEDMERTNSRVRPSEARGRREGVER